MPKAIQIDRETLIQLYHKDNLNQREIAQRLGICKTTVIRYMKYHNIPHKDSILYRQGQNVSTIAMLTEAKELYYNQELSFWDTCRKLNTSFNTLKKLFVRNNLKMRNSSESVRLAYRKHPNMGYKKGNLHPRYNGYRTYESRGYIRVYKSDHPKARLNGYVGEHILVWEDTHHRILPDGWVVHHLNGIKNDNRPENLVGMPDVTHRRIFAEKAKRIRLLENRVTELEHSLSETTKMNLH